MLIDPLFTLSSPPFFLSFWALMNFITLAHKIVRLAPR